MADSNLEIRLTLRDEASRKLQSVSQRMDRVGRSAQTAGMELMKFSAPFAALGFFAVKAASDFESSFAGVRKTVDATEEQFQDLADSFRQMSKEIPTTVNELNSIAESAGQLGIEVKNIKDFTRTIADIAVTTNLTADAAASGFARIANITGLAQTDFDKLGSALVDLGNNLATTEAEILQFSLRIAGAGTVAGLSQAEIMGIAGAFASVGVPAERGGTAVQTALIKMHQAATEGGELLEVFAGVTNQTTTDFARMFKEDAAGAFTAFVEGIAEQGDEVFGMFEKLELTDKRLMSGFLSLAGAGDLLRESMELGNSAFVENTALAAEAEQRYNTFASKMAILKNNIIDAAIELGTQLMPKIEEFTQETLIPAIGKMGLFIEKHGELIGKGILLGVGIGILGALMVAFGVIVGALTKAFVLLRTAVMGVMLIVGGMVAIFGGPVTAVLLGLAAVIALVAFAFKDEWAKVGDFILKVNQGMAKGFQVAVNFMIRMLNHLIDALNLYNRVNPFSRSGQIGKIGEVGSDTFGGGMGDFTLGDSPFVEGGDSVWERMRGSLNGILDGMKQDVQDWAVGAGSDVDWGAMETQLLQPYEHMMGEAARIAEETRKKTAEALGGGDGGDGAGGGGGAGGGTGGLGGGVAGLGNKIKESTNEAIDFRTVLKGLGKTMKDDVSPIIAALVKQFPDMTHVQAFEFVLAQLQSELRDKLANEKKLWEEHYDSLTETAEAAAARIAAAWQTARGDKTGALGLQSAVVGPGATGGPAGGTAGLDKIREFTLAVAAAMKAEGKETASALMTDAERAEFGRRVNEKIFASVPEALAGIQNKRHGGFVGGREGSAQLVNAHAGELVLNRQQQRGLGNTVNITVNGGGDNPQRLARLIADEVNLVLGQDALRDEQVRRR